jgi:uncharacterized protein
METVGYAASILMGLSLGIIGGGGSILTIPIFVYLFGINPVTSTSYSLFVVGITSLVGSLSHFNKGNIHMKTAMVFGIPSVASVYLVRKFALPAIPDIVFQLGSFSFSKPLLIMVVFAMLMLVASVTMIRRPMTDMDQREGKKYNYLLIFIEGMLVGGVTGLVGAGGGFLVIPALVLMAGLPMKQAIGTSLLIIALKSLIGFTGDLNSGLDIDYTFMLIFSAFAMSGIVVGSYLTRFISNEKLKPAFGWFVLTMGLFILGKELLF